MSPQATLESDDRPPRSWWRFVYRIGLGFLGLLFSLFPWLCLFVLPDVKGTATDRALAGLLLTASVMIPASFLALTVSSGDRLLFSITPLTPRIYFRRQLALNWPYQAAVGIAPAAAWLTWQLAPAEARQGFQWTLLMAAEAVAAYYAFLLVPVTLFVHNFRFEIPHRYWLTKRKVRRNQRIVAIVFVLSWVCFYFWYEFLAGLRAAMSFVLDTGTPGVILVGLISPGSILAVQGREPLPAKAGLVLVALWTAALVFEIAVLAKHMRRTQPRFEVADVEIPEEDRAVQTREIMTAFTVVEHGRREHLVSDGLDGNAEHPYDIASSPEDSYMRQLNVLKPIPRTLGVSTRLKVLFNRYSALAILLCGAPFVALEAFAHKSDLDLSFGVGIVGLLAVYTNLLGGIRWARPLRISLSLPLRLNRLALRACALRPGYQIACDLVAAGTIVFGLRLGWADAIVMMTILLVARVCGQIRSWLSMLYGGGRKTGSWLYEFPLMLAPFLWLFACSFWSFYEEFNPIFPSLLFALFWLLYGLVLVWCFDRKTDTSVPRVTSSYRPGAPGTEPI